MKTLRIGSRGKDVSSLQSILTRLGFPLRVDGIFGKNTRSAVMRFQQANRLKADGIVGKNTWAAINRQSSSTDKVMAANQSASVQAHLLDFNTTPGSQPDETTTSSSKSKGTGLLVLGVLGFGLFALVAFGGPKKGRR